LAAAKIGQTITEIQGNWLGRLHYFSRTTVQNFLDNGI